jgi:NADH-quinone oxidoreductase subunit N
MIRIFPEPMLSYFNNASLEITLLIAVLALFVVGMMLDKFKYRKLLITASCFIILFFSMELCLTKLDSGESVIAFNQLYVSNLYVNFFKLLLIIATFIMFLLFLGYEKISESFFKTESLIFIFVTLLAGFIMLSANDLIPFYLGIELLFICVYALICFDRAEEKFLVVIIKYFLINLFFSSLMLYGIVLLYGSLGTTNFSVLADTYVLANEVPIGAMLGVGLLTIGFVCKLFGTSLNIYSTDIYENISLPISMFLLVITKLIMLLALLKLFVVDLSVLKTISLFILKFSAIAFMCIGAVFSVKQSSIKKVLALATIYNIGWILLGGASNSEEGIKGAVILLIVFMTALIGLYALIFIIKGNTREKIDVSILKGLEKTNPVLAYLFAILLLSIVGIPPFSGAIGRFYIVSALINVKSYLLVFFAISITIVFTFNCLKILKSMYFSNISNKKAILKYYSIGFVLVASSSAILNLLLVFAPNGLNLINTYLRGGIIDELVK